jgi:seryl-tRNA synthetase
MIDPTLLRTQSEMVQKAISRKKFTCDISPVVEIDAQRRELMSQAETKRALQNAANKKVAALPKESNEFKEKLAELKGLSEEVKALEAQEREIEAKWDAAILNIPNMPHASVPDGKGEEDNVVFTTWGDIEKLVSPHTMPHFDIPSFGKWIDFPRGVKVTGAGFPFYVGNMARFVRTLLRFFLDEAQKCGYTELLCPLMVNTASGTATGQLPDKESQMYLANEDDFYLIPTAELPVTNFYRDEIFEEKDLPVLRCAHTPCFRREAGSWGAHVRGLNRLHQFDKVELVRWSHPSKGIEELEELCGQAQALLKKLEIPYRVLLMCSKDIGFQHSKQYDLEVWAGGQKRWLEVSSCSNFSDFQARRAGTRFRPADGGKPQFVHTLNGSGLAIPRVLAAILENNLMEDGRVRVPDVLVSYYGSEFLE